MEYFDFLPGIEGLEGEDGDPVDLKVVPVEDEGVAASAESCICAILVADSKRRSRRISSSISCWARRRSLKRSALALFHREKRITDGDWWRLVSW